MMISTQDIEEEYRNRNIIKVSKPVWDNPEKTSFTADVIFVESDGPVRFTALNNSDTKHGQEIWEQGIAGAYGEIAAPPSQAEMRKFMPPLSAKQLRLALLRAGKLKDIPNVIVALSDEEREEAEIEWEFSTSFQRNSKFVNILTRELKIGEANMDEIWVSGGLS